MNTNVSNVGNYSHFNLKVEAKPLATTLRMEAALTSGVVSWNRLPASFCRVNSANQRRVTKTEYSSPTCSRTPSPALGLQPESTKHIASGVSTITNGSRVRNVVVTLPSTCSSARPKSANFPTRTFLAGYRQIPSRSSSAMRRDVGDSDQDSCITMLSPNIHNGASSKVDLDRMDAAELNQIFEELAGSTDVDDEVVTTKRKRVAGLRGRVGFQPAATEISVGDFETASDLKCESLTKDMERPITGRTTPTCFRPPQWSMTSKTGRVVQSQNNFVYIPRPKTRLCRVYIGSAAPRQQRSNHNLEFVPMHRPINLYKRGEPIVTAGIQNRDERFSANLHSNNKLKNNCNYDYTTGECIMCHQEKFR